MWHAHYHRGISYGAATEMMLNLQLVQLVVPVAFLGLCFVNIVCHLKGELHAGLPFCFRLKANQKGAPQKKPLASLGPLGARGCNGVSEAPQRTAYAKATWFCLGDPLTSLLEQLSQLPLRLKLCFLASSLQLRGF